MQILNELKPVLLRSRAASIATSIVDTEQLSGGIAIRRLIRHITRDLQVQWRANEPVRHPQAVIRAYRGLKGK